MALIQFSCIATGPFITFKETAERIFEALGEPFHEHGAFAAEDLPSILAKLDAAAAADRKLEQEIEIEREKRLRTGSYDAELRALEAEKEQTDKTKHHENSVRLLPTDSSVTGHDPTSDQTSESCNVGTALKSSASAVHKTETL